jgi:hypothetical protein
MRAEPAPPVLPAYAPRQAPPAAHRGVGFSTPGCSLSLYCGGGAVETAVEQLWACPGKTPHLTPLHVKPPQVSSGAANSGNADLGTSTLASEASTDVRPKPRSRGL